MKVSPTQSNVTVVKWEKHSKENNCLENIIANNYDLDALNIEIGSEEYYALEEAVMDANVEIYGENDKENSREKIIDGSRRNTVLYVGDEIVLPDWEKIYKDETPEEEVKTETASQASSAQVVLDEQTGNPVSVNVEGLDEALPLEKDDNNNYCATYNSDEGTVTYVYNKDDGTHTIQTYDKNGLLTQKNYYDKDNQLTRSEYQAKDALEKQIENKESDLANYVKNIDENNYVRASYDVQGSEYKVTSFINKEINSDAIEQKVFDESGNLITTFYMHENGEPLSDAEKDALDIEIYYSKSMPAKEENSAQEQAKDESNTKTITGADGKTRTVTYEGSKTTVVEEDGKKTVYDFQNGYYSTIVYNPDGTVAEEKYEDEYGNSVTKEKATGETATGEKELQVEEVLDSDGKLTKKLYYGTEDGKLQKAEFFNEDGNIYQTATRVHNEDGSITDEYFNEEGLLLGSSYYTNDMKLQKKVWYNEDGTLSYEIYGEDGQTKADTLTNVQGDLYICSDGTYMNKNAEIVSIQQGYGESLTEEEIYLAQLLKIDLEEYTSAKTKYDEAEQSFDKNRKYTALHNQTDAIRNQLRLYYN